MTESTIHELCEKYNIRKYSINNDGSIDVGGNVNLDSKSLTELPLRFNKVKGYFNCESNLLTTLKGAPVVVGGGFNCCHNMLSSLEFGPREV